jgi:hypothetical protein
MYTIDVDPSSNLLTLELSGFLSVEEIARCMGDMGAAFRQHRMKAGYLLLIDTSGCSVQLQEVLGAFQTHAAAFPKARRIAVVNTSSLIRMQVRRVLTQSYMRLFESVAEARAWLFSEHQPAAPDVAVAGA